MASDMIARGMANSAQKKADSAYDLAAGRALALSVTNIENLVSSFKNASDTYAKVGDNIYVQQLNVPDFWVFKIDTNKANYTYTTDQAFLQAIARNGYVQVGYFQISQLEAKHQVTFGYYYDNQFYYNAGHTDQIVPDENGMFFDITTKDGYVYRDRAYTQIINSTEEAEREQADLYEASARAAADTALGKRIDDEETARENADTAEKNAREAADANEKTLREATDSQLARDLAAEAQARAAADDTLQDNIDAETTARFNKDEELTNAILDEIQDRETADTALGTRITNESNTREGADTALGVRIDNEVSARQEADEAIRTWAQQQITEKIDNSLYKIEFTIPATIWKQGVLGTRYLPKITFGGEISLDAGRLLILRSNDPKFVEYEVKLVGQGNENGCGYILIDCDYYSKAEPSFPDTDINCVLYVITLTTKVTTKTNGYVEVSDEAWLDPSYIPATENVSAEITQNGSTLEVE